LKETETVMKAVIITKAGSPSVLSLQERPVPQFGPNEVRIAVMGAGVNRPDVAQRKGNYPPPPGASTEIPGLEVAGTIVDCGALVKRWKKGDQVCALLAGGGYAEYVSVNEGQCLPIPKNFSFAEAAGLPETVFTVWNNVFQRGHLKAGECLLIHGGSSGIGITAIQLAKAMGARVVVTVGSETKGLKCLELGADQWINYKEADFEAVLGTEQVDVVLDMIGGAYFEKNLNILKPEGRLVYINAMQGNLVELNIAKLLQKRLTLTGSTLRSRDSDFKSALAADIELHVWPLIEAGKFKPVIYKVFNLAEADQAHELIESSSHIGKIVLITEQNMVENTN
jgi:NADPH2:quinone reductase